MKWTPRDTAHQLQRLTRHSSIVQTSKYALIGVAALLILMVFLVPVLHENDSGARLVFTNAETGEFITPRMSKPRLQGMDKNNRPYTVTAQMAERQSDGRIKLSDIEADIALSGGSWLAFIGDEGMFDAEANTLLLPKKVQVFHNSGYEMRTSNVFINLETTNATGNQQVDGQGPLGTISAAGFSVDNSAGQIKFTPKVKVTLIPQRK
ncbi:MAG: LPS export ABC transporter periplasmic protein LptC [Alphaproteobacteria bacterium]|nr:LPS export ABC transporter periplasmic protein LptC [Alphaproteobacteria bacterium]